jgi:hypothetical protein
MRSKKPEELEQRIREGAVEENPTWEELIEYENLLDRLKRIQRACYLLRPTISG